MTYVVKRAKRQYKRTMPYLSNEFQEWQHDLEKLNDWHQRRRLGVFSIEDLEELEELQLHEIGSYMIYRHSVDMPFWDTHGNQQLEKLDRWR